MAHSPHLAHNGQKADMAHADAGRPQSDAGRPQAFNQTRGTVLAADVVHARSFMARFMGLMGRASLAPGTALWLEGNGIHMFFMRFPIDAVFVARPAPDGTRRVLSTHRAVRPWIGLVPFVRGAHGVLELPAGVIDASGTAPGDLIRLG